MGEEGRAGGGTAAGWSTPVQDDHGQSLPGQRVGDEGARNAGADNDDVALRRRAGVAHFTKAIRQ